MSKGCFIRFIIILTILVAAILYIVQTKLDDWILEPGKGVIKSVFNESWNEDMTFVKPSAEKDSLHTLIEKFIDDFRSDKISNDELEHIKNNIEAALADSIVDDKDLEKFRNLLRANQ